MENNVLKNSAYIGGGALAAIIANRLLGNNSLKSNLISGAIGAALGGGASILDNPNVDMSDTVSGIDSKLNDIKDSINADAPKAISNKPGVVLPFLTSPISWMKDIWVGGKITDEQRAAVQAKVRDLRRGAKGATAAQLAEIDKLSRMVARDAALDDRQGDALWTVGGGTAGTVLGIKPALKLQTLANKHISDKNVKMYQKWLDILAQSEESLLGNRHTPSTALKKYIDAYHRSGVAKGALKSDIKKLFTDKSVWDNTKQLSKDVRDALLFKRNQGRYHKAKNLIDILSEYRLNHYNPNKDLSASDNAARVLDKVIKHRITPDKVFDLSNKVKKLPLKGKLGIATLIGTGLLGAYTASAASNYPGSKNKVAKYSD